MQSTTRFCDLLHTRLFVRYMGGGPRTFPGGLNKWQWKRQHEKAAREKEKRLLDQEKQLYQARIRSQIRSKLAGNPDQDSGSGAAAANYNPMTPKDHVKALADRFMKEGAEDLWNEDDGPLKSSSSLPRPSQSSGSTGASSHEQGSRDHSPIDLKWMADSSDESDLGFE